MSYFYVPCSGDKPAALSINGHKLLIVSRDEDALEESLNLVGADHLQEVVTGDSQEEEEQLLNSIAKTINCGVVVAPNDIQVPEVIKNLELQLPWVQ